MLIRIVYLCLVLFSGLWFSSNAYALVLNRVATVTNGFPDEAILNTQIQVGEALFFVDAAHQLFITDGTEKGTLQLVNNVVLLTSNSSTLVDADELVYVIRDENESHDNVSSNAYFLWRTDGTIDGTYRAIDNRLPSTQLSLRLASSGSQVFLLVPKDAESSSSLFDLLVTTGTATETRTIDSALSDLTGLCTIAENNFYFYVSLNNDLPQLIMHFSEGDLKTINLPEQWQFDIGASPTSASSLCLYRINDALISEQSQVASFNQEGELAILEIPILNDFDGREPISIFVIDEQVYFRRENNAQGLFELNENRDQLVELGLRALWPEFDFDKSNGTIRDFRVSKNFIYIRLNSAFDSLLSIFILDSELGFIEEIPSSSSIDQRFVFAENVRPFSVFGVEIVDMSGEDFFLNTFNRQLVKRENDFFSEVIRSYDVSRQRFIRNGVESSDIRFLIGRDVVANNDAIYIAADAPSVSERIAGAWLNNDSDNDGVNISVVLGGDGETRTLLLSVVNYLDGQPVWLFGAAPISDGEFTIDFPIQITTGLNYFEADTMGERNFIGQASLAVIGCNEINITFDLAEPFQSFNSGFTRSFDVLSESLCEDN